LGHLNVPLLSINLKSGRVTGPVIVGERPFHPVQGVSLVLGNDLAGLGVMATNSGISSSVFVGGVSRAMARKVWS